MNRMIVAMVAVVAILGAACGGARYEATKPGTATISNSWDRMTATGSASYEYKVDDRVNLRTIYIHGSKAVSVGINTLNIANKGWQWMDDPRLGVLLVDGERVLFKLDYDGQMMRGGGSTFLSERLDVHVPVDAFKGAFAKARSVEFRFGMVEFALSPEGLAKLKEYASTMPAGGGVVATAE